MMMYENRVTFKKFGDTPKDMTWWEFYQLTREIFDDTAAGPKTWQNHFGGADDEETTVQDTANESRTEETEVIEAVYGTRKEYMDRLSEQGMAEYMADEYKSHRLLVTDLENIWNLCKWLSEKVDRFGKPMEDAR